MDDQFNTLAEDAANDGLGRGSSYIPNSPDPVHDPFTALAEDAANDGLGRISSYIPNSPESEALPTSETLVFFSSDLILTEFSELMIGKSSP